MRFTPLIGRKVWFGPRRGGWGWDPVSWEGWASLLGWALVSIGATRFFGGDPWIAVVLLVVGLVGTCVLKGTPPGGPEAADRFHQARRYAKRTPEMMERDRRLRRVLEDEPSVHDAARRLRDEPVRRRRR